MPHLLRFSRDLESRLERLCQQTGISKAELIERCVDAGLAELEAQLLVEGAGTPRAERSLDQLLRESGLGA
jgi:RHH-type transcriptional regulator, rel operon repressor / antitoxin RelB